MWQGGGCGMKRKQALRGRNLPGIVPPKRRRDVRVARPSGLAPVRATRFFVLHLGPPSDLLRLVTSTVSASGRAASNNDRTPQRLIPTPDPSASSSTPLFDASHASRKSRGPGQRPAQADVATVVSIQPETADQLSLREAPTPRSARQCCASPGAGAGHTGAWSGDRHALRDAAHLPKSRQKTPQISRYSACKDAVKIGVSALLELSRLCQQCQQQAQGGDPCEVTTTAAHQLKKGRAAAASAEPALEADPAPGSPGDWSNPGSDDCSTNPSFKPEGGVS
jgi:hypothetical protein